MILTQTYLEEIRMRAPAILNMFGLLKALLPDFGKRLGLKEDMDIFAYMKETKYEETDWVVEIARMAVRTDSSECSSDDQYYNPVRG
jgi:hypothetical protein